MARVPLIERRDGLTPEQADVFDGIVASRGRMLRPYEVLLHVPDLARLTADLGGRLRFASALSGHDRELAIIATAKARGCGFEWEIHLPLARQAGVREEVVETLEGEVRDLTDVESGLLAFVSELSEGATVTDDTFARVHGRLGAAATIELATTVGYYTMLAYIMGAVDAC